MNGDINTIPGLQEKIAQAAQEKEIIAQANTTPLPGALRETFSPAQNIVVGQYTVRPFYDIDFEVLQMTEHPFAAMALGGEHYGEKLSDLRGRHAWLACWLLTHSVDEVDEASQSGCEAIQKAARREFGRKQLGDILELSKAVLEQFGRYFSTVTGIEAADAEDGAAKKA